MRRSGTKARLGVAAVLGLLMVPCAAQAQGTIKVVSFPAPDASSASPKSEISFRGTGATPAALKGVVVTGSRSGAHGGALKAHADGHGVSFVPVHQFASGERVRVRVPAAVRVLGGDGRIDEFTTAQIVSGYATEGAAGAPAGHGPFAELKSRPDLAPPTITALTSDPGQAPGDILIAPKLGTGQGGPMIVDSQGTPLWFQPLPAGIRATDFREQTYQGKPVLTWWQGAARGGSGRGEGVIADASYRIIKTVKAGNGLAADLHEFALTDHDTALLISYVPVRRNLGAIGSPVGGIAVDGVAQEVELSTGRVRFEWHSLDHVAISDTDLPRTNSTKAPFDYFHMNSFNVDPDGGYVLSGRHVSTVYKLDFAGDVEWRLGGKSGTLKLGPGMQFDLQHNALGHGDGIYTIFDNSAEGTRKASRALTVHVDAVHHTATLVRALVHPANVLAATQGNVQLLDGGDTLVGWGSQGRVSEFSAAGQLLLDLKLPKGYDTYRAYRFPWVGTPITHPRVVASARGARTAVYVSWNGSTETASWTMLAGASAKTLAPVKVTRRTGLETASSVPTTARYVAVQAVDASGNVLSQSAAVRVSGRK
jgi:hypothetical protein